MTRKTETEAWIEVARATLRGSETGTMTFPASVRWLTEAGLDGYAVDFRRATHTYYMPNGAALELHGQPTAAAMSQRFDADAVREAIGEAQAHAPGYTYRGFCDKVAKAGCAGYLVSLTGRRVLYYGRSGETHTEFFPDARP